jgi:hypothetical protein
MGSIAQTVQPHALPIEMSAGGARARPAEAGRFALGHKR